MKIGEIKKNNFYTDGEKIVLKNKYGFRVITEVERDLEMFANRGNDYAAISEKFLTGDFRKVKKDETFYNGEVKVIDGKNIEILNITILNAKYDNKGYIINKDEIKYNEQRKIVNISKYAY